MFEQLICAGGKQTLGEFEAESFGSGARPGESVLNHAAAVR